MTFTIKSQIVGSFSSLFDQRMQRDAKAITDAVHQQGTILKNNWRAQIVGAGLSTRLGNTVRSKNYPQTGTSLGAASEVSIQPGSPQKIIAELEEGAVITVARGRFLAIPTSNVPRANRGVRFPPHALEVFMGFKLRYAENRRGTKMLVGDAVTARNGRTLRPATKRRLKQGREKSAVVFYILVPQVTMKKRLNLMAEAERIGNELGALIAERLS